MVLGLCASAAFAQGGKAEPKVIEFAKGRSNITVTGTLSNGQEMDHVFKAVAGQKVSVKVTSKPKGHLFDFRLKGDGFEIETDHDSYTEYDFIAPQTGSYLLFVRKRPTQKVPRARFFLRLSVR
jgi:hypothetical protein